MQGSLLTSVILPISLAVIMFGMGLSLVIDDFKRVFLNPKAALIGLVNQLLLLPIVGFSLALVFKLSPEMGVGLMIIASCPGGPTSNLITHVCKGDIALSISLTAISSLITVLTIPIILSFSMVYFTNAEAVPIEIPVLKTILQIMVITVIPVSLGMLIQHFNKKFADSMDRPIRIASTIIFIAVLVGVILANKSSIIPSMKKVGLVALSLNIITMIFGFYSSRFFKLNIKQSIAITIESGIQNGTLAIVIAASILKQVELSIPAAVYSLIMFLSSGFLMWKFGKRKDETTSIRAIP